MIMAGENIAMKENELVSVIMPAYKAEKYIAESIESVINQTYFNWELIIIHDGSPDKTKEIIIKYARRYKDKIRVIDKINNEGTVKGLNSGLDVAKGVYICWLSADDLYYSNMIEDSLCFLKENIEFDAVFSKHEFIDSKGFFYDSWDAKSYLLKLEGKNRFQPYRYMMDFGNGFCFSTLLAREYCFRETGYFCERYKYAHDYEYSLRLASLFNIGFLNKVTHKNRIHVGQITNLGNNEVDAMKAFADIVINNVNKRNKLLKKAGYREDEITKCINKRIYLCSCNKKELSILKEYDIGDELLSKVSFLLRDYKFEKGFFEDDSPNSYLMKLCKNEKADAVFINKSGIRFERYFDKSDAERFGKGLERNNKISDCLICEETMNQIISFVTIEEKFHFYRCPEKKEPYKIIFSEYMLRDSTVSLPLNNKEKKNVRTIEKTIWDSLLEVIMCDNKMDVL